MQMFDQLEQLLGQCVTVGEKYGERDKAERFSERDCLKGSQTSNESTASTCERGGDFSISSRRQLRLKLD